MRVRTRGRSTRVKHESQDWLFPDPFVSSETEVS